jgi:hypothetical protein
MNALPGCVPRARLVTLVATVSVGQLAGFALAMAAGSGCHPSAPIRPAAVNKTLPATPARSGNTPLQPRACSTEPSPWVGPHHGVSASPTYQCTASYPRVFEAVWNDRNPKETHGGITEENLTRTVKQQVPDPYALQISLGSFQALFGGACERRDTLVETVAPGLADTFAPFVASNFGDHAQQNLELTLRRVRQLSLMFSTEDSKVPPWFRLFFSESGKLELLGTGTKADLPGQRVFQDGQSIQIDDARLLLDLSVQDFGNDEVKVPVRVRGDYVGIIDGLEVWGKEFRGYLALPEGENRRNDLLVGLFHHKPAAWAPKILGGAPRPTLMLQAPERGAYDGYHPMLRAYNCLDTIGQTEHVAVLKRDKETVENCKYAGAPSGFVNFNRARSVWTISVYEARTGKPVAQNKFRGGDPPPCPATVNVLVSPGGIPLHGTGNTGSEDLDSAVASWLSGV